MHKKNLLFFAFYLLFSGLTYPQQFPFVQYTPKDGLVNSRVRKVFQDSKGRMYFLTYGGLSVYDGSRFRNYTTQNGLGDDMVNDIIELGEDSLLVATNTDKLNILVRGEMRTFEEGGNNVPVVNQFLKSEDGSLYVTSDAGLQVLRQKGFEKISHSRKIENHVPLYLGALLEYRNFLVFASNDLKSNMGLFVLDKKSGMLTDSSTHLTVLTIGMDRKNRIWLGLNDHICLLDTLALQKGKIRFEKLPAVFQPAEPHPSSSLAFDEHYVWINNRGKEIMRFGEDGSILKIPGPADDVLALLGNLWIDRENILWICNEQSGVLKLVSTSLQVYEKIPGLDLPVHINQVYSCRDTTWYALHEKALVRKTRSGATVFTTNIDPIFLLAQHNEKLIAGDFTNVFVAPLPNASQKAIQFKLLMKLRPGDQMGGRNFSDSYNNLFFYSKDSTMVLQDNKVVSLMANAPADVVEGIQSDSKNRLWMATRYMGLAVFEPHRDYSDQQFKPVYEFADQMREISVRSMVIDRNDVIWVGTRHDGLVAYELVKDSIRKKFHFQTQQGLTDNFVTSLACDSSNRIIVGTQTGVDLLSATPEGNYRIENITKSNNLFGYIKNTWVEPSGQAFALRTEGTFFSIAPTQFTASTYEPTLFLDELKVNGNTIGKPLKNMELKHTQGNISFSVAAPSFLNEKQVQYSYRLLSEENSTWSEPTTNSSINFLNLAPGKYTLQIKASFLSTPYPAKQITYAFTILPPWWKIWWVRALAAILLIGLITIVIRSYFQRKLEKEKIALEKRQAIEKERTRIATDMHDDLGAGLSRIKYLSETIRFKRRTDDTIKDEIEKISAYSDEMVEKMGEIVWALNQKNDTLADLVAFTRSYALDYLTQHDLECHSEIKGEVHENPLNGETRRNIFLSVKESLHNIVKHANATKVELVFDMKNDICIRISDNGKGFDLSGITRKGNGLDNIQKRMQEVRGDVKFLNKQGTTVVLRIPFS